VSFEPKFQGNTRFEVRRKLGEGGMGQVFDVLDRERGSRVALKVLSRMSPSNVEQFKNEFRGLSGVHHPSLVRMHELIADGAHWCFTMDLVDGVPFIDHVRGGLRRDVNHLTDMDITKEQGLGTMPGIGAVAPALSHRGVLNESALRAALAQLVAGVHAIHVTGKVHRDLKHSNVLVEPSGRVVILDFGLVTDAAVCTDLDAPGGVWGTPAYMAPEQAAGKRATAASDWYAVGVMLYEALCGELPFTGKAQEVLLAKQRAVPVSPSLLVRGVPPDLEALCLELLRFRASERPRGFEILARLGVKNADPFDAQVPSRPPFVGRTREIAAATAILSGTTDRARVVTIEGVSGMGKSALADELIDRLRLETPGLMVLAGRCYARESVPFKAFDGPIGALAQHLANLNEHQLAALIPPGGHALTQMFPALLTVPALKRYVENEPLPADPKELRRRAFTCLRSVLDALARERPCLVYVDDMQWGDEDSARLWSDLLSGPNSPPLSFVCTFRSDERQSSPCLRVLLGSEGLGDSVALRLQLSLLSAREMSELATSLLPPDMSQALQQGLVSEAAGNPYFALELAREIRSRPPGRASEAGAPTTLEQALSQRVARLPSAARQLLRVVSVAARPLEQRAAFEAADQGLTGLSSLTELQSAHLIRLVGSTHPLIAAYHDRIRETVTDHLAVDEIRAVHASLAKAIEHQGNADPERLMEHLLGAGELARAAGCAAQAAEQAAHSLAFDRAARLYQVALEHTVVQGPEQEAWRVSRAEALINAGRGGEAARVYLQAAAVSKTSGAELRRLGAERLILSGHIDEGIAILGDVLTACGLSLPESGQALAQTMALAMQLRERGLQFEPREQAGLPPEMALRLEVCWAMALGFTGSDPERLMPIVLQHLLDALDSGSSYHVLRALCLFIGNGAVATRPGSRTIATALAAAEALRGQVNTPDTDGWVALALGMTRFLSGGDAMSALAAFETAEGIFRDRCRGASREVGLAQVGILASLAECGCIARYRKRYPTYLKDADERSDLYLTMYYRSYHGAPYYLAADDPTRAWSEVEAAERAWGRSGFDQCALFSLLSRMEILLYQGGPRAYEWSQLHGPRFLESILTTGHYFRARFLSLRGRAAVAASLAGGDANLLLERADQDLKELRQSELKMAPPHAMALHAAIAAARGDRDDAWRKLGDLTDAVGTQGDTLLAKCAAYQRARLRPDFEQALPQILHAIADEEIRRPERWAAMLIPIA